MSFAKDGMEVFVRLPAPAEIDRLGAVLPAGRRRLDGPAATAAISA